MTKEELIVIHTFPQALAYLISVARPLHRSIEGLSATQGILYGTLMRLSGPMGLYGLMGPYGPTASSCQNKGEARSLEAGMQQDRTVPSITGHLPPVDTGSTSDLESQQFAMATGTRRADLLYD